MKNVLFETWRQGVFLPNHSWKLSGYFKFPEVWVLDTFSFLCLKQSCPTSCSLVWQLSSFQCCSWPLHTWFWKGRCLSSFAYWNKILNLTQKNSLHKNQNFNSFRDWKTKCFWIKLPTVLKYNKILLQRNSRHKNI